MKMTMERRRDGMVGLYKWSVAMLVLCLIAQVNGFTAPRHPSGGVFSLTKTTLFSSRTQKKVSGSGGESRSNSISGSKAGSSETTLSVGIDLGTTYSLVSVVEDGKPRLLKVDGSVLLPSVVGYKTDGTILVGKEAQKYGIQNPKNVFTSVKRLIGRTPKEAKANGDSRQFGKRLQAVEDPVTGKETVGLLCSNMNEIKLPEEISAQVLKKLLTCASEHFDGKEISNAVITVPAYFTKVQNEATERAGKLAGLKKIKLLKEPEAAALAYGFNVDEPRVVMVFDLGGGTFDVSVLEVGAGLVEVIATSGDGHLGGDDFDQIIIDYILRKVENVSKQSVQDIQTNAKLMKQVRELAIQAKHDLTTKSNATMEIVMGGNVDNFKVVLTRKKFEELSRQLLTRLLTPVREAALMASINLPGESGDIGLQDLNDEDENSEDGEDNDLTDEAVTPSLKELKILQSEGRKSAKEKSKLKGNSGKELRRLQKLHGDASLKLFPTGKNLDDVILVGGATRMPCIVRAVKIITGIDPKRHINPDEAICLGAGVMSGVLDNKIESFQVLSSLQAALLRVMHEQQQRSKSDVVPAAKETAEKKEPAVSSKATNEESASIKPVVRKSFINKIVSKRRAA